MTAGLPAILLIQFRKAEATAQMELQSINREMKDDVTLTAISALDEALPWNTPATLLSSYQGVIFGGSGDFDFDGERDIDDPARTMSYQLLERLRPLIAYIFENDIPTLGICYGHQLLGAFSGVAVLHDSAQRKMCSHEVHMLADANSYWLCANLPTTFKAQYGHKDVLERVPDGATLLIEGGDSCRVSALRYTDNIYSTQFHPELTLEDMKKRVDATPGYLPEGVLVEEIFEESPDAHLILRNFGRLVKARSEEKRNKL